MKTKYFIILIFIFFLISIFYFQKKECLPISTQKQEKGSHGYRIWSGPTLKSFSHNGEKICIPYGWKAVGAVESGDGWAVFEDGKTGVIILSSAFTTEIMNFMDSNYKLDFIYPKILEKSETLIYYRNIVNNSFSKIGKLFGDKNNGIIRNHTVLVTSGLGSTDNEEDSIYPDPNSMATFLILKPNNIRTEEFFIHAVTHLYNRQRIDLIEYQNFQKPISGADWQELEASWAETSFRTSIEGRERRVNYIYNVHNAVKTKNFSLINSSPFNDFDQFSKMKGEFFLKKDSTFLDTQYSHYILGPIIMIATEGLLQKYNTGTNIEEILTKIHKGEINNFFEELVKILPKNEINHIYRWIDGEELVPRDLIDIAIDYYNR